MTALLPPQVPLWQVSVCVQALPSLHVEPSALLGFEQTPGGRVARAGVVALIERRAGDRLRAAAGAAWQVSVCVQALPSLHVEPSALLGFEQVPVAGSHVPASWH